MCKTCLGVITLVLLTLLARSAQIPLPEGWEQAEREIKRLPPAAFPQLPEAVVKKLEARGCTIPQSFIKPQPHNVIRGEFARKGQRDWAVLCSTEKKSTILVFWGKPTTCPNEVAIIEDRIFLQTIDEQGKIGYSRFIERVGADYILEHYGRYGGPKPPHHEGINDAFVEKTAVVHYCYEGKWFRLPGAD